MSESCVLSPSEEVERERERTENVLMEKVRGRDLDAFAF